MKTLLPGLLMALSFFYSSAQCPVGQIEVTISVKTDMYGNEGYWELVPAGNVCGTGPIFSGGNPSVGCNGAGNQASPPGGYPDTSVIVEGPWCLTLGSDYDIIFNDDWLDGGLTFTVSIGGYPLYTGLTGSGAGTRLTFTANPAPSSDVACRTIKTPTYVEIGNVYPKAWIANLGTDTINSFDLYYSVDNGPPQMATINSVVIAPFDSVIVSSTTPWNLSTQGSFSLIMYANSPNGVTDMNSANDTSQRAVSGGPGIPNIIDNYLTSTPQFTVIGDSNNDVDFPTDLDFHPVLTRYELWVTLRGTENTGGSTVKFTNAGQPGQTSLKQKDGNSWHFMSLPSALAFSDNENFATSTAVFDANHNGGDPFTGPALWSSDPAVYAITPPGGNGSHLDMLHESPYSMGICSEDDNKFWVYDDYAHDIVSYDFRADHGPGNNDHSDGIIRRYTGLGLMGDPNHVIGSHLILDKTEGMLYIADTENDRILKMDINSGTFLFYDSLPYEPVAEYSHWNNVTSSVFVGIGLNTPSGIDLIGNRLIVSEYHSGDIVIYDIGTPGTELGRIQTGAAGIMGVKVGPDGKIWFVNSQTDQVIRIDQMNVGLNELTNSNVALYPNPANDNLNVLLSGDQSAAVLNIHDAKGSLIATQNILAQEKTTILDISTFSKGVYTLSIRSAESVIVKMFVKS